MLLPEVNVWLALTFDSHVHHPGAKHWFNALSTDVCLFCRLTQIGFLRLTTNSSVFGKDALTLDVAWQKYNLLLCDARVSYVDEPTGLKTFWRAHAQGRSFSPKVWTDAYLAAFAQAANLEVVSFDRGMAQYQNIRWSILS
ncbi:MAG TPA: TA system VapC family ribonuclease toxin [Lacipirellulaceae bacterium]|jgi:hypothetical protein|nr:TA system VapC family ribonuclease toxin [Lacipirellulaceae bacterium]